MRVGGKVWIAIVALCAAITIYEAPRARLIWRYVRAVNSDKLKLKDGTALESVPSDEVVGADPEAADILTYCLTDPNREVLAELVEKYPENEFFLTQLAYELHDVNVVDPRATLVLVDRLIAKDPANAHYHYIKGYMLLKSFWNRPRELEALEQFRKGNDLPDFFLPYSQYKQSVDQLCERAGVGLLDRRRVVPSETGWYRDLRVFLRHSRGNYPMLSSDLFRSISAEASELGTRLIDIAATYGSLDAGCFLLLLTEFTRLRELGFPEEQAQQLRFRLAQAMETSDLLKQYHDEVYSAGLSLAKTGLVLVLLTAVLLPGSFPLVWLSLVVVNGLRGRAKDVSVGIKTPVLFVFGLLSFFALVVLCAVLVRLLGERVPVGIVFAGTAVVTWLCLVLLARISIASQTHLECSRGWGTCFCAVLWVLGMSAEAVVCHLLFPDAAASKWLVFALILVPWSVFCTLICCVAAFRRHLFRVTCCPGPIRNRCVQLVLLLMFMSGILALLQSIPVLLWGLALFTTLIIGMVSAQPPAGLLVTLQSMRRIFSRKSRIVALRTKMARMMGGVLLVCWVTILACVPLCASKCSHLHAFLTDPLSLCRPLPQADRESYERALSKKYAADPNAPVRSAFSEDAGLPEHMHLASPEDLSTIINERQAVGKPVRERLLRHLMPRCGHDVRPIVLRALKDPNTLDVLMRRAEWKDMSAKDQLNQIFEEKMAKLVATVSLIQEDPNGVDSLIVQSRWGDKLAEEKLEQVLEAKMAAITELSSDIEDRSELRVALKRLLEMNAALPWSGSHPADEYRFYGLGPLPDEQIEMFPYGPSDPNARNEMREGRGRNARVQKLVADANMPELLEDNTGEHSNNPELLTALLDIAGALAFISEPGEAEARFSRLMDLAGERAGNSSIHDLRQSEGIRGRSGMWKGRLWWYPGIFYRALAGVPRGGVTSLLKEYLMHRHLADPFEQGEFDAVLENAGDRELAEWVLQKVLESPPTLEEPDFSDWFPIGQPVNASDVKLTMRSEDGSHFYLEPAFPYLSVESVPLLLELLGSDKDQLRAFSLWAVTSLGHDWPEPQLATLRQDSFWKLRLNALFAFDQDALTPFTEDENPVIRVVAQMLTYTETP